MILRLFYAGIVAVLLASCCSSRMQDQGDTFVNPVYDFPSENLKEPEEGYPHPVKQYPYAEKPERPVSELIEFTSKIKKMFGDSNLTPGEADEFYTKLEKHLTVSDESYGEPGGERGGPVNLRDRVMIRKVSDNVYEIFYYNISCGINYNYSRVELNGGSLKITPVEAWSETYPC